MIKTKRTYYCDICKRKVMKRDIKSFKFLNVLRFLIFINNFINTEINVVCLDCSNSFKDWYKQLNEGKDEK